MKGLYERLKQALIYDPNIVTTRDKVLQHKGNTLEYLQQMGLRKSDLRKLEMAGFAVRGYTFNGKGLIEKDGKQYKQFGKGSQVRWILLKDEDERTIKSE